VDSSPATLIAELGGERPLVKVEVWWMENFLEEICVGKMLAKTLVRVGQQENANRRSSSAGAHLVQ